MENEILMYGEIGVDVIDTNIISQVNSQKNKDISLRINSGGGEVFQGYAMFNALLAHKGKLDIYIDGVAASMASVFLCVPNATVHMAKNAMIMIHNPAYGYTAGDSKKLRQQADILDKIKATVIDYYTQKTNLDEDILISMLDAETWFNADEALQNGFIDEIIDDVLEKVKEPTGDNPKALLMCYSSKTPSKNPSNFMKGSLLNSAINFLGLPKGSTEEMVMQKITKQRNELVHLKMKIKASEKKEAIRLTDLAIEFGLIPEQMKRMQLSAFDIDFEKTKNEVENLLKETGNSKRLLSDQSKIRDLVLGAKNISKIENSINKPKNEWDLNDYRKFAPHELENKELYTKLLNQFKEKIKK